MKHHFKINPLATAILTLLCGSSASGYAASNVSSDVNAEQLKQRINETYPGEAFFSQYYVDKSSAEAQQRQEKYLSSAYCEGTWVTPIAQMQQPLRQIRLHPPLLQIMDTTIQQVTLI